MKSLFRISVALSTVLALALPALGNHPNHQHGDQLHPEALGPNQLEGSHQIHPEVLGKNQHGGSQQFQYGAPESNQHRGSHQFQLGASEANQHGDSPQFMLGAPESNQHEGSRQLQLGSPEFHQHGGFQQFQFGAPESNQHRGSHQFQLGASEANQHGDSPQFMLGSPESNQHEGFRQFQLGGQEFHQHGGFQQFQYGAPESDQHRGSHQFQLGASEANQHGDSPHFMLEAPESNQHGGSHHSSVQLGAPEFYQHRGFQQLQHGAPESYQGMHWSSHPGFDNTYRRHQSPRREWPWSYQIHGDMQPAPVNIGHGISSFREIPVYDDVGPSFAPGGRGRFQGPRYHHLINQDVPEDQPSSSTTTVSVGRKKKPQNELRLKNVKNQNPPMEIVTTSQGKQTTDSGNLGIENKSMGRPKIGLQRLRNGPTATRRPTTSKTEKPRNTSLKTEKVTIRNPIQEIKTKKTHLSQSEDAKIIYKIRTTNAEPTHTVNDNVVEENEQHGSKMETFHHVPSAVITSSTVHSAPDASNPKRNNNISRLKTVYIPRGEGTHQRFKIPTNRDSEYIEIINEDDKSDNGFRDTVLKALANARTKYEQSRKQSNTSPSDNQDEVIYEGPLKPTHNPTTKPINLPSPPVYHAPIKTKPQVNNVNTDKGPTANNSDNEFEPNTEEISITQPVNVPLAPVNPEEYDDKVDRSSKEYTEVTGDFEDDTERDKTDNDDDGSTSKLQSISTGDKGNVATKPSGPKPRPTKKPSTSSTSPITNAVDTENDDQDTENIEYGDDGSTSKLHSISTGDKGDVATKPSGPKPRPTIKQSTSSTSPITNGVDTENDDQDTDKIEDCADGPVESNPQSDDTNVVLIPKAEEKPNLYQMPTNGKKTPIKVIKVINNQSDYSKSSFRETVLAALAKAKTEYLKNKKQSNTSPSDNQDKAIYEGPLKPTYNPTTKPKSSLSPVHHAPIQTKPQSYDTNNDKVPTADSDSYDEFDANPEEISITQPINVPLAPVNPEEYDDKVDRSSKEDTELIGNFEDDTENDKTNNDDDGSTSKLPSTSPGNKGNMATKPSGPKPRPTDKSSTLSTSSITNGADTENGDIENIEDYPDDAPVEFNPEPNDANIVSITKANRKPQIYQMPTKGKKTPIKVITVIEKEGDYSKNDLRETVLAALAKAKTEHLKNRKQSSTSPSDNQDEAIYEGPFKQTYYPIPKPINPPSTPVHHVPIQIKPQYYDANNDKVPTADSDSYDEFETNPEEISITQPKNVPLAPVNPEESDGKVDKSSKEDTKVTDDSEKDKTGKNDDGSTSKLPSISPGNIDDVVTEPSGPKPKPTNKPSASSTFPITTQPKNVPLAPVNPEENDDKVDRSSKEDTELTGDFEDDTEKDKTDNDDDSSTSKLPSTSPGNKDNVATKPSGPKPRPTNKPLTSSTSPITNGADTENDDTENIEDYPDNAPVESNPQPNDTNMVSIPKAKGKPQLYQIPTSGVKKHIETIKIYKNEDDYSKSGMREKVLAALAKAKTEYLKNRKQSNTSPSDTQDEAIYESPFKPTYHPTTKPINPPKSTVHHAPSQTKPKSNDANTAKVPTTDSDSNDELETNSEEISVTQTKDVPLAPVNPEECDDKVDKSSKEDTKVTGDSENNTDKYKTDKGDDGSNSKLPSISTGIKDDVAIKPSGPKPRPTNKPSTSSTSPITNGADTENDDTDTKKIEDCPDDAPVESSPQPDDTNNDEATSIGDIDETNDRESETNAEESSYNTSETPSSFPGNKGLHITTKPSGLAPKPTNKPSTSSTSHITNGVDTENDDKDTEDFENYPIAYPDDAPVQSNPQPDDSKTNNTSPTDASPEECDELIDATVNRSQPSTPILTEVDTEQGIEEIDYSNSDSVTAKQPSNPSDYKGFYWNPKPSKQTNKPSQHSTSHVLPSRPVLDKPRRTKFEPFWLFNQKPQKQRSWPYRPYQVPHQSYLGPRKPVQDGRSPVLQTQYKSYPHLYKDTEDDLDDFGDGATDIEQAKNDSPSPADFEDCDDDSIDKPSTQTISNPKQKSSSTVLDNTNISSKGTTITPADDGSVSLPPADYEVSDGDSIDKQSTQTMTRLKPKSSSTITPANEGNNNSDNVNPDESDLPPCEEDEAPSEAPDSLTTLYNKWSQTEKASTEKILESSKTHIIKRVDGLKCVCEKENIETNKKEEEEIATFEKNQRDDLVETAIQNDKVEVENDEELSETDIEAVYLNEEVQNQESENIEIGDEQDSIRNTKRVKNNKGLFYNWFNRALKG